MPLSEAIVDCGEGDDTVIADRRDLRVTKFIGCETILAGVAVVDALRGVQRIGGPGDELIARQLPGRQPARRRR